MTGSIGRELRHAARGLVRSPTVAICSVLCLALGVGATTAISSALNRALLQPLPFRDPERLVAVHRITPQSGPDGGWSQSAPNYVDLRDQSRTVTGLAAITWGTAIINLPSDALQVSQHYVTGNLFNTLGVTAQHGRLIQPDDDRDGAPPVAVLHDDLWRSRFGADPSIVGRQLIIDGQQTTVIGVTPPGFRIPHRNNVFRAELWQPIRFTQTQLAQRRSNNLLTFGRLARGATVDAATSELRGIFAGLVAQYPQLRGDNVRVAPLHAESMRQVRRPLLLVFGAVCMVLLIAATNVAALLLARGVQRQREMAVRTALGATRWDTVRPVLLESLLLSALALAIGVILASVGVRTIGLLASARLPQLDGLRLDTTVLVFAIIVSAVVTLVCGAVPGWRASRVDPQDALRGGRGGGTGREDHRALRALVVGEIALSLVLLVGAGLVLKDLARLLSTDPGFDTTRILTLRISSSPLRYSDASGVRRFVEPALEAIDNVPGVEAAGATSAVPYVTWGNNSNVRYEGVSADDIGSRPIAEQRAVTPGYFTVTRQRLIAGRLLTATDDDRPGAPLVVVVNQALVKRDFPNRPALGQRFHFDDSTLATIVGVVSDVRNMGPFIDPRPEMYWSYRQLAPATTTVPVMVRVASGDPAAVAPSVRAAVRRVDPAAAVSTVQTMDDVIARSLGAPRFYFSLLGTFAAIAIVLAVAGLYGVLSYAVAQRTREIGIRAALGSPRAALVRLFALDGFRLVVTGVAIGVLAGLGVTRTMEAMLHGISPLDLSTWLVAILVLIVAATSAALLPARRAARVDPLVAMRME